MTLPGTTELRHSFGCSVLITKFTRLGFVVIASLASACGRPALDETGLAAGLGYDGTAVGQRSTLLGAGEPACELDRRSLEDPHWCQGRQRPGARLLDFVLLEAPTPAAPVWRRRHGSDAQTGRRSRCA